MLNTELETRVNQLLNTANFKDHVPNGLQVEGRCEIHKVVTGVTACQALLDEAVRLKADAVLVHHGYFWKSEPLIIKGMKRQRLKTLLINDINLFGWHLPLDAHPVIGNNAQLAKMFSIEVKGKIAPLLSWGELEQPISGKNLVQRISQQLKRKPLYFVGNDASAYIRRVAWSTGSGQSFIDDAAAFGVDAFISGEVSEQTIHSASEQGLHFFAAGHHATERCGIKALGDWLNEQYYLDVTFIDIFNPV